MVTLWPGLSASVALEKPCWNCRAEIVFMYNILSKIDQISIKRLEHRSRSSEGRICQDFLMRGADYRVLATGARTEQFMLLFSRSDWNPQIEFVIWPR